MAKKKKAKKKPAKAKKFEVYCFYERAWVPMGRSKKKCPKCGAVVGKDAHSHQIREIQTNLPPAASPDGPEGRCRC